MRLPTLSAALTLLLLVLSCLAVRCDAACDLAALHGSCHHAASAIDLPADSHCMEMAGSTHHPILSAPATPCPQHNLCLAPALARTPATPALPEATLPPPVAVIALRLLTPFQPQLPAPTFFGDPPPLRSTPLRV